jgi:hypothetical protein
MHYLQSALKLLALWCRSSEQDVTAVVGAVNATTIFLGALYALNVLPVISVERAVYYRERASFFYHSLPFSLAQCTVELPYIFVQACVYSCIVYWCAGLELNVGMPCFLSPLCLGKCQLRLYVPLCCLLPVASFPPLCLLCVSSNVNHGYSYHFAVCCMLP